MFQDYEIKRIGYDEVIYLYLDLKYEMGIDFNNEESALSLTNRCYNFIKNNHINYHGNKIYLVIDGLIIKALDLRSIR